MAGLAQLGGTNGWDTTFDIGNACTTGTYANTATSQFKLAFIQASTTAADFAADMRLTTTMVPVGVIQSMQDTNSSNMVVRVAGVTKCFAGDSITAGAPVTVYNKAVGNAECGYVTYFTAKTDFTSSAASERILGIALSGAQKTGAALSVLLIPQLAYSA